MASAQQSSVDFRLIFPLTSTSKGGPRGNDSTSGYETPVDLRTWQRANVAPLQEVMRWKLVQQRSSAALATLWETVSDRVGELAEQLRQVIATGVVLQGDARTFSDNLSLLRVALLDSRAGIDDADRLPSVERIPDDSPVSRAFALASSYFAAREYVFDATDFAVFLDEAQECVALQMAEIWSLKPFLEFVLLCQIATVSDGMIERARKSSDDLNPIVRQAGSCLPSLVRSLRCISDLEWKSFFERIAGPERVLRMDPQGAYEKMDFPSREAYRAVVAELASHSKWTERDVAARAIELASASKCDSDPIDRLRARRSHVGYYLVDSGLTALKDAIGYRSGIPQRVRDLVLKSSDYFYLVGIELATLAMLATMAAFAHSRPLPILALVLLALPALECAVTIINSLATRTFPPKRLPKLDFSKGIPSDCVTVVAVPTLLTSEEQVRAAVQGLETRFLANRDTNLHFALLTDPPDSTREFDEKDQLAGLCANLIEQLNQRYSPEKQGSFFLFHRHRSYNSSEELWMGWERKRGKLLDFNRFLLGQSDQFPVKVGELSRIANVRYVITLDLDTQLPAESARKLVGALAHPLNRAVFDPRSRTVVAGYGILQPRVDISVRSVSRSRLASLLSGDTGVDLYTRAVSDVYQDLFGEGIFTGKGIYEVEAFQQVLEHRFPCNAVLSHDLIEGLYARTGFVSDVEVVDDYPSHFSAFSRRKHRWVRGDWQIIFGLFSRVRDSFGHIVRNPLNHISRWKIIDNLRRSLMECAVFLLLLCGWLFFPERAGYLTLAALALMVFPACFQLLLSLFTARRALFTAEFWIGLSSDFFTAFFRTLFRLAFLLHQTLVAMDAVIRVLVRMRLTHRRLLQWETAADAEAGAGTHPVDLYLKLSPLLSFLIGVLILAARPASLKVALPFLAVWAIVGSICKLLNTPQTSGRAHVALDDYAELRQIALRTWRFFREFSNASENWLVPDIVQESPPLVAHRISTTNLGLLLNARLAAHDLGFLTLGEFIEATEKTLETVARMPKFEGHLYNWYTTDTLEAVEPRFVSTVDNGNLLCSLWTLKQGCLQILQQPLFQPSLSRGIQDVADLLVELSAASGSSELISATSDLSQRIRELAGPGFDKLDNIQPLEIDVEIFIEKLAKTGASPEIEWWSGELSARVAAFKSLIEDFAPWKTGEHSMSEALPWLHESHFVACLSLESIPGEYEKIVSKLDAVGGPDGLREALARAADLARDTMNRLTGLASSLESMAKAMEFGFLYDSKKKMISIGYEGERGAVSEYHYDLLASEARAALFAAIAKGEIPQESWFELGRSYVRYAGHDVLRSWTGTAFEYLMPCLWMRSYPNTLLDRCAHAAVRAQQVFIKDKGIPWGISESSCNQRNPDGHYRYHAFGVPDLAINRDDCSGDIVIAPYATFLALPFDAARAMRNIRKMKGLGWLSSYGFYEAADFTPRRVADGKSHEIVRNWMAHHQGMSLVAVVNVLCDSLMQRRFHAEPCVAAYERLLHEKYPRVLPREKGKQAAEGAPRSFIDLLGRAVLHPQFRNFAPRLQ
jgi:cyclic beta-1,2-glucan synthetase